MGGKENKGFFPALFFICRFLIMVDEPALIHAFPVLGHEFPVCARFHDRVALLPADEAFHQAGLLIDQFHDMFFFGHHLIVGRPDS
jgi:hypothetical protein